MFTQSFLYIDPAVMGSVATALVGVGIAVGSTILLWGRMAKKKVAKTLHIDENANKTVEEDIVINDEAEAQAEGGEKTEKTENAENEAEICEKK